MSALSSSQLARVLRDWLAVEKESTRVWLRTEMDRLVGPLVDSVFARLTNKLAINTDSERIQEESNGSDRGRVKREIEEDCEMSLQNVMDSATQTNEQIGDFVKREIKEEEEDGQIMHIKKEEDEEVSETQINDVDGFAEDNQDGDDGGSRSEENAPMDCVKREIKEEYEDGQMMEIKKEEDGETNEVDLGNTNEGDEADDVNRMSMNNANVTDIDTLFARWMRDEVELGEPTRANLELMPISNEPQSNLTNREEVNEDYVNHNTQQQFDETNNNGGIMDIEEKEEVGDGKTRVTDIEELAANEGGDESHSVEGTQIGTTPPHLTRQSPTNISKSARRAKRKQKVPQAQVRNEVINRDSQEDEEKGQVDEVPSRHVKKPRIDTTQANNAQAEVARQFPRQTTDEAQSNKDRQDEEGDPMGSGQEPIGEDIATECTSNPIQPNHHLQCPHCHKSFVSKYKLQTHLRVHTGERPFQCDQCDKRFKERSNLTKHQLIHQNIKLFQCHECEKQFTRKDTLDSHLRIHSGERPFACRHCEMSFAESFSRNNHEQAIHLHVKPYRCKQCGYTATERSHVIKHIRVVHFGLPQTIKEQRALNIIDERDPRGLVETV